MNKRSLVFLIHLILLIPLLTSCTKNSPEKATIKENQGEHKKYLVTFVELGSKRCIPCKKMMPIMKEIEEEYGDQVKVVFHDVWTDEGKPFAAKYQIRLIPTQVFLDKDGQEYFRHEGFFPKEELVQVLKRKGIK